MAKMNVKVNFKTAKKIAFDKNDALNIGTTTVQAIKEMISKGQSPVKGVGRFKKYSGQGDGNYPQSVLGRHPNKKMRPVNLYLNGWYLSHLTWWFNRRNKSIGIGFSSSEGKYSRVPTKVQKYFEAHNDGMHPHVPQRKHLPNKEGDRFAVSVERAYKKEIERFIARKIDKMNKRK